MVNLPIDAVPGWASFPKISIRVSMPGGQLLLGVKGQ